MPIYYGTGVESHNCGARDAAETIAPRRLCRLAANVIADDNLFPVTL